MFEGEALDQCVVDLGSGQLTQQRLRASYRRRSVGEQGVEDGCERGVETTGRAHFMDETELASPAGTEPLGGSRAGSVPLQSYV